MNHNGYRAYQKDGETYLRVRKPAEIVEGALSGTQITVCKGYCDVWTSQKRRAIRLAREHGLEILELDGEAVVIVPDKKSEVLFHFGAKKKRTPSKAQMEVLRRLHQEREFNKKPSRTERPGDFCV